jgi:predicted nucleic acid-binding protein
MLRSLLAPELLPFEVANILRRHALAGILDATAATLAYTDLLALPIKLYPYAAMADRASALRANLTAPMRPMWRLPKHYPARWLPWTPD